MTDRLVLAAGSMLDASPDVLVRAAHAAGFDGVGLRLSDEHPPDALAGVDDALRSTGLPVHDAEVHRISGAAVHDLGRLIERTVGVDARHLLIVSDLGDEATTITELAVAAEACRVAGITPAIEYMAWTTPHDPASALRVAEATDCVIVVDLLHHARVGAGAAELDAIVASGRLGWVQLCDARLTAPTDLLHEARHERLAPGDGELPLRRLLDRLPGHVTFSVEVQSDELSSRLGPIERARYLYDTARAAISHRG